MSLETALLLLLAHLLGDYTFQTKWMLTHKAKVTGMAAHIGVHLVLTTLALGQGPQFIAIVIGTHLAMDLIKTHLLPEGLWSYLLDQAVHLSAILLVVSLGAETRWALPPEALTLIGYICGLLVVAEMGGPAVGYLMSPYQDAAIPEGLPEAGRMIGLLERSMIFLFVVIGTPEGIGFLIAAKSVLRFETASKEQRASEYVIIGTMASFAWALTFSFGTLWALEQMALTP